MLTPLLLLLATIATGTDLIRRARRLHGHTPPTTPAASPEPGDTADREQLAQRFADAWQHTADRPSPLAKAPDVNRPRLPRRLRQVPIQAPNQPSLPLYTDRPLTTDQKAHVDDRWPHLVSSYFRESHQR